MSLAMLMAPAPARATRLAYDGHTLSKREVAKLSRAALAAPGNRFEVERFLGSLVTRLQTQGHLDARAEAQWEPARDELQISVTEGPLYRIGHIGLETGSAPDSAQLAGALRLSPGAVVSPRAIGVELERVLGEMVDLGHPYASLAMSRFQAADGVVDIALSGALGPRVTISEVRVEGLEVTREDFAARAIGRLVGQPFQRRAAELGRERLLQLGLFRTVRYVGLEGEADWRRARLRYQVEERRFNRFEGVIGVQGDAGTVGLASLEMDNVLGTGRGFGLHWESRAQGRSELSARYAEPLLLGAPLGLQAAVEQQVFDSTFVQTRWGVRGRYALSGQEHIEIGFEEERVVQEDLEVQQADLQNTVFALERDARDEPLATRQGTWVRVEAAQIFKTEKLRPTGKRSVRSSAAKLRGEWHRPLGPARGITLELMAAGRFSSQRVLPLFERYPLGGASSLRGFDEEAMRVDRFVLGRLEWRWFLGASGQRAFLFWDHAWASTRRPVGEASDRIDQQNFDGFGFGVRLEAAGGLVGIDYGLQAGKAPLEGKVHLKLLSLF